MSSAGTWAGPKALGDSRTVVAAGILERDGLILIAQRRADQPHASKWEFPGGKLEVGETPAQALIRELREELGIEAADPVEIARYEYSYPGKNAILLVFLRVTEWQGEIENRIFAALAWEPFETLSTYDFLEGDRPFLSDPLCYAGPRGYGSR